MAGAAEVRWQFWSVPLRFHGCLAPHYKYRDQIVPQPKLTPILTAVGIQAPNNDQLTTTNPNRMSWARLLKRIFNVDVEECPNCGKRMRIIAAIEEPAVIKKILDHLGLSTKVPQLAPARAPPDVDITELCAPAENFWQD
jgi:hypothetical protein